MGILTINAFWFLFTEFRIVFGKMWRGLFHARYVSTVSARMSKPLARETLIWFIGSICFDLNKNVELKKKIKYENKKK